VSMASQQVLAVKQHWETMARQLLMLPLGVLVVLFLLLAFPLGWQAALRIALAGMFLLTASAHWGRRRPDLIRMVPDSIPRPDLLVTVTGLCEILGAIGLLVPPFTRWAAIGLAVLLIALFPANVRASREGITIGGKPATPLLARSLIQVVFLMATIAVAIGSNG
jgi:uncharacterized membrane protein